MNEEYAADPAACENAFELAQLLKQFGPYSGRYLVRYPGKWVARVYEQIEALPDGLQKLRAKRALEKVKEEGALLPPGGREWIDGIGWLPNAERVQAGPNAFDGVVVARRDAGRFPCIEDFEPPPSEDVFVPATAIELARVAEKLLGLGPAAHLVDPYFNPCRKGNFLVLVELLTLAQRGGRCSQVDIWTLADESLERNSRDELSEGLVRAASQAGYLGLAINLNLLEDRAVSSGGERFRLHARYLLTKRGALRYDTGFREEKTREKVEVSIVGRRSHEQLVHLFVSGELEASRDVITVLA